MDYKKFFEKRNIEYQEGLNEKEISHIEEIYDIFSDGIKRSTRTSPSC